MYVATLLDTVQSRKLVTCSTDDAPVLGSVLVSRRPVVITDTCYTFLVSIIMTVVGIEEILGSNPTAVTVSKIETIGSPSIMTATNMKSGGKPNPEMIGIIYIFLVTDKI